MFQAIELRKQLAFALDAEGSDHYRDDLDYIPAINASMKWLTSVINSALGQNKLGEEFFRDVTYSGVFKTDENSRISLSIFPNEVWTILSIFVDPEVSGTPISTPNQTLSYFMTGLIHLSSDKDCKRLSPEEWARNKSNPFEAGYEGNQLCDDLKDYAYLSPVNYHNTNIGSNSNKIEVRPKVKNDLITIFWVKKPQNITLITDNVEFPNSVFQLLFDKALQYIAYKQGDNTTTYSVSDRDIQQLISLI